MSSPGRPALTQGYMVAAISSCVNPHPPRFDIDTGWRIAVNNPCNSRA